MPELPDIVAYIEALHPRVLGQPLQRIDVRSPFVLRSVRPPLREAEGKRVTELRRIGKRIVFGLEDELFLIVHLMIAGRFHWKPAQPGRAPARVAGKIGLAAFHFPTGALQLTEASTRKRAGIHLVQGETALAEHDPGGIDVLGCDPASFAAVLKCENHTLKRSLTDPRLFSGIGNAYSDEILHRARLSPVRLTSQLEEDEILRLLQAAREVLQEWTARLREQAKGEFPEQVTAFRPEMAVHGRYGQPCPVCRAAVQRIRYADNETNYCVRCQTGGKLLADRSLSRLLRSDWPRTLEELEERSPHRTNRR